ncbi:MAG TPA: CmpA/NrtA family ABC transporter substrate-binding protein, partial [Myxococcota bacterium]|nr:CmpA/NrtA family ABC transporter substrate-binding protein [Myxococcota bacterium]
MSARPLRIGITPLCDSAPIVVAAQRGFFAEEGLDVSLSPEPSWANIRDKLAAGALDAAHLLAPLALASTLGVGPLQLPLGSALSLGLGGNAITASLPLWKHMQELAPEAMAQPRTRGRALAAVVAARRAAGAPPLRLATVFPVSMHSYELRFWLADAGIAPDRDVRLLVVPPPRMVAELEAGSIDGFCVGEPWNSVAVLRGSGAMLLTKHDLWNGAPEKVLGVTRAFAEEEDAVHRALLRAVMRAARWCDEPENRPLLARLLARHAGIEVPVEALLPCLSGELRVGPGPMMRHLPEFHAFDRYAATFPWRSHAAWMIVQMLRWGHVEKSLDVRAACEAVYWTELHREVAAELGIPRPDADEKIEGVHAAPWMLASRSGPIELGPDLLLDGSEFDARHCTASLATSRIHAMRVSLDELEAAQRT